MTLIDENPAFAGTVPANSKWRAAVGLVLALSAALAAQAADGERRGIALPVPVSPPTFEIDGREVGGEVVAWESSGKEVEHADGVLERAQSGVLREYPSARLTLRTRQRRGSPVVRFRYELEALAPEGFALTKASGRDNLVYGSVPVAPGARMTEIRLSEYDPLCHCHRLTETPMPDTSFVDGLSAVGPIVAIEAGDRTALLAYEHGSQSTDRFVAFACTPNRRLEIRAVKGNYWRGRRIVPGRSYETIWLQAAEVQGGIDAMAAAYRAFQLKGATDNPASRAPLIFYNTWASQERDYFWGGSRKYLNLMNEKRILADIDRAAEMNIDVFVVDTGWFEKSGDWRVSRERFPNGLEPIVARLREKGMQLGLWFSPTEAAESSAIHTRHPEAVLSLNGIASEPHSVWETEQSRCHCLVSEYWQSVADELIRCHRDWGVTYFKWDAIGQYGCDSPNHFHGDASVPAAERADCYAFEQVRYMARIVDRLCEACPGAIVDFDVTEGGRCVGLAFLASGKYFAVNNGPYFPDLDHPYDKSAAGYWSNVFVYPGSARPRVARTTLDFDRWIPSVLFLTHYLPDAPRTSQKINLASLVLGQNGIWGDLSVLTQEDRAWFGEALAAYKRVRDAITSAPPLRTGVRGGSPEVHEKLAADGAGALAVFAAGGEHTYVTAHRAGPVAWKTDNVTVSQASDGRARATCRFDGPDAALVLFEPAPVHGK